MKAKIWTSLVILLLIIFLGAAGYNAWRLLTAEETAAQLIGVGAVLVIALGAWVLVRELLFGLGSERLGRILDAEGGLPEDTVERSPGGRPNRQQADEQFGRYAAEAEANPEDWRSWFRLSVAYDVASDRSRARKMMRRAIRMQRSESRS
ncbi:hypothetical protein Q7C18_01515 [Nesterenkonia sp. CL21]|uniref:hypothetical protein n=1 Tax=Nesterenkonia sp. CL21 TaxID=3064894 RepID=UPI002878D213|nr:hypothetical protein [Nesterenkonia sp. CL21]MDS2171375.1 hypothetical protein [Nesterenkonia sp. CL21]